MSLDLKQAASDANNFKRRLQVGMEQDPITKESAIYWLAYLRAVRSVIDVVEAEILAKLKEKKKI